MKSLFLLVGISLLACAYADDNAAGSCTIFGTGCGTVSVKQSYVDCNATTRKCYCLPTFDGNASVNNPCDCIAPKTVFLSATVVLGGAGNFPTITYGTPYCVDLPTLKALQAADTRNQKHIASVVQFLNNTVGSTPQGILATKGIPQLVPILSPNVKSRISPAGQFDGFEGVVEYFYGFVANPSLRVVSIDIREVSATGNTVSAKANIFLHSTLFAQSGGHPPEFWNLTTFAFFTFDDSDLISSIDVSVPNLGAILDVPATQPGAAQLIEGSIQQICATLTLPSAFNPNPQGTCGALHVWAGATPNDQFNSCVAFMHTIPYGTRERNNANNFVCRSLHTALTFFRPDPHCYHAGPDGGVGHMGGGACIDFAYSDYYLVDY